MRGGVKFGCPPLFTLGRGVTSIVVNLKVGGRTLVIDDSISWDLK